MKKLYILASLFIGSLAVNAQVVISQVYGGGGNAGATYSNDFIELFNAGTTAQSLAGWSVQYTSANGPAAAPNNNWFMTPLPSFTLQPGQYFLIQQAAGSTPSTALPTPDVDGITAATTGSNGVAVTTGIAMSGSNGKVILVSSTTPETTANPTGAQIIDKVAYGTTSTSGFEGTGPTGTALTSTTSAQRINLGCTDTNNNPTDFIAATPVARNSSSPVNNCALSTNQDTISGLKIFASHKMLYVTSDSSSDKNVVVYDLLGKIVVNETIATQAINVSHLATGAYIVKVTEDGKTATKKLVIE